MTVFDQLSKKKNQSNIEDVIREWFPVSQYTKGSSRIVVPLDTQTVLKVAYNEKGVTQNITEATVYNKVDDQYKGFFATVYESYNGIWLVQEKIELPRNSMQFKDFFEVVQNEEFQNLCTNTFQLCIGDLRDQWGFRNSDPVLYDYGLDQYCWNTHYEYK